MRKPPTRRSNSRALVEAVEGRQLLSATLNPATHLLTVNGTAGNDNVTIDIAGDKVKVTEGAVVKYFPKIQVTSIAVNGFGGHDNLKATNAVYQPMVMKGGEGNDNLRGGSGADKIYGENG